MREFGKVWSFKTDKLEVSLRLERVYGFKYDGDDEDGSTQAALDSGEYVAFNSEVRVKTLADKDEYLASVYLGSSVYRRGEVEQFYTLHRDPAFMNRNCSLMRAVAGNLSICHYFPDMVREAIEAAREELRSRRDAMPIIR